MPNKYIILVKNKEGFWKNTGYAWGEHEAIKARDNALKSPDVIQARYELL